MNDYYYTLFIIHYNIDIIKKYNPNVKGFSVGIGNQDSANARFNRAVSAAKAEYVITIANEIAVLVLT